MDNGQPPFFGRPTATTCHPRFAATRTALGSGVLDSMGVGPSLLNKEWVLGALPCRSRCVARGPCGSGARSPSSAGAPVCCGVAPCEVARPLETATRPRCLPPLRPPRISHRTVTSNPPPWPPVTNPGAAGAAGGGGCRTQGRKSERSSFPPPPTPPTPPTPTTRFRHGISIDASCHGVVLREAQSYGPKPPPRDWAPLAAISSVAARN